MAPPSSAGSAPAPASSRSPRAATSHPTRPTPPLGADGASTDPAHLDTRADLPALAALAKASPERHLGRLLDAFSEDLHRYFRMHGMADDCETLVQDVFVRLANSLQRVDPARIRQWVWTIAINVGRNELRRRRREVRYFVELEYAASDTLPASRQWDADTAFRSDSAEAHLWAQCDRLLTPDLLATLRLSVQGYDTRAIATELDIDEITVRTRLHRARTRLRNGGIFAQLQGLSA